ncbi:hypothetical protein AB5N19_11773 [Seiridium cardinale]|uniref:Uncharacterized protein n=1 Tax=Seiridium cardinale TaxID=138064 RepID=A0ABR2XHK0_9PEZI
MSPIAWLLLPCQADSVLLGHLHHTRNTTSDFRSQWENPSDILSLLLILGPEVVWRALAQLSGGPLTPAVFSFGWVAYAVNALVATFGDYEVTVIGAKSGHSRANRAWIIGRMLRDYELSQRKTNVQMNKLAPDYEALRISVFQVDRRRQAGLAKRDWVWYSGFAVTLLQLVVSLIPLAANMDWAPLLITIAGTLLALLHGAIFQ